MTLGRTRAIGPLDLCFVGIMAEQGKLLIELLSTRLLCASAQSGIRSREWGLTLNAQETACLVLNGKASLREDVRVPAVHAIRDEGGHIEVRVTWEAGECSALRSAGCRFRGLPW